jgi:tetratricopeptide (TPR) repeat protein
MGWLELERKDKKSAEIAFKKSIALDPGHAMVYEALVRLLAESGRYKEALEWNQRGKNELPKNAKLILNEANIYFLKGEIEKAKTAYQKYLELTPNDQKVRAKLQSIN